MIPRPALFGFFAIFGLLVGLFHLYVWLRLVRDTRPSLRWRRLATVALIALWGCFLWSSIEARLWPTPGFSPLRWVGLVWLGVLGLLMTGLLIWDGLRSMLWGLRKLRRTSEPDPGRRLFLARAAAGGATALALGVGAFGMEEALRRVQVRRMRVNLAHWPSAAAGYRLVQISDVHIGPTLGRDFVAEVAETIQKLKPNLIAITGDLVDGSVEDLKPLVAPLGELHAPDGIFFVTGNHEYYVGAEAWLEHLSSMGIRPLRNERVPIGVGFDLAGVHDWSARHRRGIEGPNLARALEGRDPKRPVILLAHQPKQVEEAAERGVDLQLSGHTHGGQMFPMTLLVHLFQPYVVGLHRRGNSQIYVSPGTGYWGPPMRVGTRAEVTALEIYPASRV